MEQMTLREELVTIIQQMPAGDLGEARRLLRALVESRDKRSPGRPMTAEEHLQWMHSLPEEDYEMTDEEKASLTLGREDIRAGRVHKFEDVAKELEM